MPETAWKEEIPLEPPKKRVPTWAWFCGGGCIALVILGVVLAGLGFTFFQKATDEEQLWQQTARILPYDERPPELDPVFGVSFGVEQIQFKDSRGFMWTLQRQGGASGAEARRQLFLGEEPEFPANIAGQMKFEDVTTASVRVQGRDLRVVRMRMQFAGLTGRMMPEEAKRQLGSMAFVDLTPEGGPGMLMLQLQRVGDTAPLSDEELRALLRPFHVGPER